MKKLFFLVSLVVLLGVSSAWAQGTGIRPHVGSTHTYTVNDLGSGASYVWTLEAAENGGGANLLGASGATSVANVTSGAGTRSITLKWDNPVVNTIYYLHLLATADGCTNRKVLAIQPANNFSLEIVNVNIDGAALAEGLATNNPVCAPPIPNTIDWLGSAPIADYDEARGATYTYGTLYFYYKITASGINLATTTWKPEITIGETSNGTVTVDTYVGASISAATDWSAAGTKTSPVLAVGTVKPTIPLNNGTIWVRITVANGTTNEATTAENLTVTLVQANSEDGAGNIATGVGNGSVVQTQKARPNTGDITTD